MQRLGVRLSVCPSVRLSVPFARCSRVRRVCCCGPDGLEISIDCCTVGARCRVRAKFHYTDPTGPARTQRSFAAKKVRAGPVGSVSGPCSGI